MTIMDATLLIVVLGEQPEVSKKISRVFRTGNSLALRVPSVLPQEVGATEQLLAGLTKENETDWGPPRGREVW